MPRVFGSNSPWLRQPSKPFRPTRQPRMLKEGWTPFQLPDAALDLDALDKEGVRLYDENKDRKALKKQWASDTWPAMAGKLEGFLMAEMRWSKTAWQSLESSKAHPWKVVDCDVLAVALQSSVMKSLASTYQKHNRFVKTGRVSFTKSLDSMQLSLQNGISPRLWTDSQTLLRWLLHRQSVVTPMSAELDALDERLKKSLCYFPEVRRLVSAASQTQGGLEKVGQLTDDIAKHCFRAVRIFPPVAREVLSFVNSLRIRLENGGLPLGARLCELGLVASVQAQYPQASLSYWTLSLQKGYIHDRAEFFEKTIRLALSVFERMLSRDETGSQPLSENLHSVEGRQALFCLLTGARHPAVMGRESFTPPGLGWYATATYSSPEFAQLYATLLGRLGAFRTLVAEYHRLHQHLESHSHQDTQGSQQHLQLSALAKGLVSAMHSRPSGAPVLWPGNDTNAGMTNEFSHEQCLEHDLLQIGQHPASTVVPNASNTEAEANDLGATAAHQAAQFERIFQSSPSKSLEDCFNALHSTLR